MHPNIKERIGHLATLGSFLRSDGEVGQAIARTAAVNPWFTQEFGQMAVDAIIDTMLDADKLTQWLSHYDLSKGKPSQIIGIIMAGNIPLVGFHDFLCAYILGHPMRIKLSGKDDILFPFVYRKLTEIDPVLTGRSRIVERLEDYDAVIATGSNNSHRYFEYYFRNHPKILRKNRNSIAILTGQESGEELNLLANDIFMYFGFGCRNVSKIYVPQDYDVTILFPHFDKYKWLHNHNKYMNNYDYNRTLLLLNSLPHLANEIVMLQESESIASPVSMLYYQRYYSIADIKDICIENGDQVQCIVAGIGMRQTLGVSGMVGFGDSQRPALSDYADGVDTLAFVNSLQSLQIV